MSEDYQASMPSGGEGSPSPVNISNGVLLGAVIFLFLVLAFVFILYLFAKRYLGAYPGARARSRAVRVVFAADDAPVARRGLDPAVLRALPATVYRAADFKVGLECAVCLSELSEGEEVRLLPKCSHGFHLECIDMWFHSHTTCPLCRSAVAPEPDPGADLPPGAIPGNGLSPESPVFPTNVLVWGNQHTVNTRSAAAADAAAGSQETSSSSSGCAARKPEGMLVIDIPRWVMEGMPSPISPLPTSRLPMEETKSPSSAKLRSLRLLLSRGKQEVGCSCSPRGGGGDIEQGVAAMEGIRTPKTPKTPSN